MIELFVSIQFVQFSKSFVAQITNMGFQTQMCNIFMFFQHPFWSKTFFTNITFVRLNMSIFNVMVKIVFHGKSFGAILTLQMHFSMNNSYGTIHILRKHIFRIFGPPPPYLSIFLVLRISKNWHFMSPLHTSAYLIYEWSLTSNVFLLSPLFVRLTVYS